MIIQRVNKRNVLFTDSPDPTWNLNMHLILGDKNNYIIDTGLGSLSAAHIKKYINNNKPIIVINTHYHWDHIWGNISFSNELIISHRICREIILSEWETMLHKNEKHISGDTKMRLPNLVFEQELYFPDDKIRLFYTPGHTIDSISVLDEKDKVMNVGDNIGDNMDEIIPSIYSNITYYKNSIIKYKEIDFDYCISGHNKVLEKGIIDKILNKL